MSKDRRNMITKKEIIKHLDKVKQYLKEIESQEEWVEINDQNCPTLKNYGVKPFRIMKRKMRKDGKVWNNINYFDAKKEAEKLGYRLPDVREILALLEQYRKTRKNYSYKDDEFLGITELSYDNDVCYEWLDIEGVAAIRGGNWNTGAAAGPFTLDLDNAPSYVSTYFGFRMAKTI